VESETKHEISMTSRATLKHIIIPGSHDSASSTISESAMCSAVGRTQNLTIREQLLSGIRFFDLRIASGKGGTGVNIVHGRLMGARFEVILNDIRSFCEECPTEFVVLLVTAEFEQPFSPEGKVMALNMMRSYLGSINDIVEDRLLCKVSSRSDLVDTPLQDLIRKKGRVFVMLSSRIFNDFVVNGVHYNEKYVQREYGFFDSTQWLRNKYHRTMNTLELLESNLREIRVHKANKRRYFVNNQFVLTPEFDGNILGLLGGSTTLQPIQLANRKLYQPPRGTHGSGVPVLHEMFLEHPEEDWNVVSLDFVDLAPSIVDLCIGFSYHPIEIQLALLGNGGGRRSAEDVTELVRAKVLRGKCLFLHPLHEFDPEDYRLPQFALTIIYKISEKMYSIVIPLKENNFTPVILLHEHNHLLAGGSEISFGEGTQGNGCMAPRNSNVNITWQKTEQMSYRFAYVDEDDEDTGEVKAIHEEDSTDVPQ